MSETIFHCPFCGEIMVKETTQDKKQNYWRCPGCESECWPNQEKLAYLREERSAKDAERRFALISRWHIGDPSYKPILPLVCVVDKGKGGSRSSGRKRKKPTSKSLSTERYVLN